MTYKFLDIMFEPRMPNEREFNTLRHIWCCKYIIIANITFHCKLLNMNYVI